MARTALLVIDTLNPYDHEDADRLADSVEEQLPRMVELRYRAARADDALTIHVNDNCAASKSACPPTPSRTSSPAGRGRRSR